MDDSLSLGHIVSEIEKVLGVQVQFSNQTIGAEAEQMAKALQPGQVMLLENLRFYDEETKGDKAVCTIISKASRRICE